MGRHLQINLENLPWPVNLLKFNQAVYDMQPGDDMLATVNDSEVLGNLRQLLSSQAEVVFDVFQTNSDYRIRITKR
jgi:TusA-related sulfurtransferase